MIKSKCKFVLENGEVCASPFHTAMYHKPRKPLKRTAIKISTLQNTNTKNGTIKQRSKPKKIKRETRGKLVKKLDDVFSKYIRYSAVESDGMVQCVTCPTRLPPQNMQNGHFISRAKYPTRWHEDNCHPQCMRDNVFFKGAYIEYTFYMIDKYGRDHVEELRKLSTSGVKIPTPVIRDMITEYTEKLKAL